MARLCRIHVAGIGKEGACFNPLTIDLRNPQSGAPQDSVICVFAALPKTVERVYARADSGFYCREAVEAYEKHGCWFVLSAQKTPRLVEELQAARWTGSPRTDADGQCEFRYQPEG